MALWPAGCIGSDKQKRLYLEYLIEKYRELKHKESTISNTKQLNTAAIIEILESKFKKAPYFLPEDRFEEVTTLLQKWLQKTYPAIRTQTPKGTTYGRAGTGGLISSGPGQEGPYMTFEQFCAQKVD